MGFAQDDNSGRAEDRQSAPHNEGFRMKKITKTVRSCISIAIVLGTVAATTAQERRITAREVVAEIQKQVGVQSQSGNSRHAQSWEPRHGRDGNCCHHDGDDRCVAACVGEGIEFRDDARADLL